MSNSDNSQAATPGGGLITPAVLASLNHDLRNPLAAISGFAELLLLRDDDETRRDAGENIALAARSLSSALDDLVVVLALVSGSVAVDPTPVGLGALVSDAVNSVARASGGRCAVAVAVEHGPVVAVDPAWFGELLRRVVEHACVEAADGTQVAISSRVAGGAAVVVLDYRRASRRPDTDVGVGVGWSEPLGRDGIRAGGFRPFIAHRLAELHGGSLRHEPGDETTRFALSVPLAEGEASP